MSLQFILGNSGSGKSHYLYQHIIEESMRRPEVNFLVLVPEQFTMQTQKDLVSMHPKHGIMNIDVLSFARLAHRIFEEVGGDDKIVLDDEGKNLILRKIAGTFEKELKVLGGNLKKQGYISEVKSVISEFTQYGIGLERLEELLDQMDENSYLSWKLQDIRKIYQGFNDYLAKKYITKEELLDVLGNVVGQSEIIRNAVIALDGFTGFTPVQNHLLGELMKICKDVLVTAEMDSRENPFLYEHPYQLFALSKQMVTTLTRIARENRIEIVEPVCLYGQPVYRFRDQPALAFLEAELFRYSRNTFTGDQHAIMLYCARNPAGEAEFAAERIRHLVRTKGYRYRDIAVITADLGSYADYMVKACARYQIPIFTDHKRSILLNSFVEYLRSLLAMAEQNFTYESVFRYLRTGHTGFTMEEVDLLENYVLALGIRGYKKWQAGWIRRTGDANEEVLERLNHLRVRFVEQVDGLLFVLKKCRKTVEDITVALYQFLVQGNLQVQLVRMERMFQEQGELALAKEYAQIYRIVMDLFDKFVELLGEEPVSLKEYCELLDAGLEEAKVGVIPPSLDQVMIGDMERTRLKEIKALFLLGVNDTLIPGNAGGGGLLSVRDREILGAQNVSLSPGAREQNYIQKFYLYMNLTKPSQKLYLSYAKSSADGNTLRPAYLIKDICRLYPGIVIEETQGRAEKRELSVRTGFESMLERLRDREQGLGDDWKELYGWYFRESRWREQLEDIVEAAFYRKEPQWISRETVQKLYQGEGKLSVTRLERFAACAYAHFLNYGLHLKEREEYRFEALDLGNIAHKALEIFAGNLKRQQLNWTEVSEEEQLELIASCVEESIAGYGNTVLYSSARSEYMIVRIKRLLQRTVWALTRQLEHGSFWPSEYELNFGSGKIDRIDVCETEDTVYVKVLDYKTGSRAFDITALYHGLQMQLVVYLGAALDWEQQKYPEKQMVPAGIFYYQIRDPFVDKMDSEDAIKRQLLKQLRPDGLVNADGAVVELLDGNLEGESEVIPVKRNRDRSLSKSSKALRGEEFPVMIEYTRRLAEKIEREMFSGNAEIAPYMLGKQTGCTYCEYRDICGFDPTMDGCSYRKLSVYEKEDVLKRMRKEV
ncbi:MAG: helicase-exonuclease AddAB subunit AddB [Hespellia sp.]|nr:helicase-exonuclease AddAB subunit AddB [Hespellia sp.]